MVLSLGFSEKDFVYICLLHHIHVSVTEARFAENSGRVPRTPRAFKFVHILPKSSSSLKFKYSNRLPAAM